MAPAVGCRVPCAKECIEGTALSFWTAAANDLAGLLSLQLQLQDGEHQACDGFELTGKAVNHIRDLLPAWPNLGYDDCYSLTRYVTPEDKLQYAWSSRWALTPLPGQEPGK